MADAFIAIVAKKSAYLVNLVVVIYNQSALLFTNSASPLLGLYKHIVNLRSDSVAEL